MPTCRDSLKTPPEGFSCAPSLGLPHVRKFRVALRSREESAGEKFVSSSTCASCPRSEDRNQLQDVGLSLQLPAYRGYRVPVRRGLRQRLHQHPGVSSLLPINLNGYQLLIGGPIKTRDHERTVSQSVEFLLPLKSLKK